MEFDSTEKLLVHLDMKESLKDGLSSAPGKDKLLVWLTFAIRVGQALGENASKTEVATALSGVRSTIAEVEAEIHGT